MSTQLHGKLFAYIQEAAIKEGIVVAPVKPMVFLAKLSEDQCVLVFLCKFW
jgi:hypothetical protein